MKPGTIFILELARNIFAVLGLGLVLVLIYTAISDRLECWGAPPVVAFHQGMTLCPGQSAQVKIPMPFGGGDDGPRVTRP